MYFRNGLKEIFRIIIITISNDNKFEQNQKIQQKRVYINAIATIDIIDISIAIAINPIIILKVTLKVSSLVVGYIVLKIGKNVKFRARVGRPIALGYYQIVEAIVGWKEAGETTPGINLDAEVAFFAGQDGETRGMQSIVRRTAGASERNEYIRVCVWGGGGRGHKYK